MTKRGLGRGLDALFQPYDSITAIGMEKDETIKEINITDIDPNIAQPRKKFDETKINELAQSIKQHGVVQPIIVKPQNGRYTLVVGERRWRAARIAGLTSIPAIIRDLDDRNIIEIALIENLQREDLNPIEEAVGIKQLIEEYELTQEEIAERIGWSRSAVTNSLRLLLLDDEIKGYIEEGKISPGHARSILGIENSEMRMEIAKRIIEEGLSVRLVEKLVRKIKNDSNKKLKEAIASKKPSYILDIETSLEECFGTRVVITPGKKKGIIEIEYYSNEDLERIMEKIMETR